MGGQQNISGTRCFYDSFRWIDMAGNDPLGVPGRSPFVYKSDPSQNVLQIESLEVDISDEKPEGIEFDESELQGLPQRPFYQTIRLTGSLTRTLEHWPSFCVQQSLSEGEPPGYPGFTTLKPWQDQRMGWIKISQGGRQLGEQDSLAAGLVEFECSCLGMLDDPSQGGLKGRYVFEFDVYLDADRESAMLTSLRAEVWIKAPQDDWPEDSS